MASKARIAVPGAAMRIDEMKRDRVFGRELFIYLIGAVLSCALLSVVFIVLRYFSVLPTPAIVLAVLVAVTCDFVWCYKLVYRCNGLILVRFVYFCVFAGLSVFLLATFTFMFHDLLQISRLVIFPFLLAILGVCLFYVGRAYVFRAGYIGGGSGILPRLIVIGAGFAIAFIAVVSLVYTVPNWWEPYRANTVGTVLATLGTAFSLLCMLGLMEGVLPKSRRSFRIVLILGVGYVILTGALYVFLVNGNVNYFSDPLLILDHIKGSPGSGTYFEWYPHQSGYAYLVQGLFGIFGVDNLLPVYVLNIGANVLVVYSVAEITRWCSKGWSAPIISVVLVSTCSTFMYLTPLVYGDTIGVSLGLAGLAALSRYIGSDCTRKWLLLLAGILLVFSVVAKGTLNVLVIAILVYGVVRWISVRTIDLLAMSLVTLMCAFIVPSLVAKSYSSDFGLNSDDGTPRSTWIAMGLMAGDGVESYSGATEVKNLREISVVAPGAFNGYAWDLRADNPDLSGSDLNAISMAHIRSALQTFMEHPWYAIEFITLKEGYLWAEPTFSTRTFVDADGDSVLVTQWGKVPIEEASPLLLSLTDDSSQFRKVVVGAADAKQLLVYGASLLGLVLALRKERIDKVIGLLATVFITGFGVFVLWEAMPRYVFFFYLTLIPLAANGVSGAIEFLRSRGLFPQARKDCAVSVAEQNG